MLGKDRMPSAGSRLREDKRTTLSGRVSARVSTDSCLTGSRPPCASRVAEWLRIDNDNFPVHAWLPVNGVEYGVGVAGPQKNKARDIAASQALRRLQNEEAGN